MAKTERKWKGKKRAISNEETDQVKKSKPIPSPPKMQSLTMQDLIKEAGEAPDVYIDDVFSNSVLLNDIHEFRTNHEKSGYVLSVIKRSTFCVCLQMTKRCLQRLCLGSTVLLSVQL